MDYFDRITRSLASALNYVAGWSIVAMMLLTGLDVILRIVYEPITGTYEIIGLLGAVTISFALAKTTLDQGHIAVKILMQRMPPRPKVVITFITRISTLFLFALLSWQVAVFATDLWKAKEVTPTLGLPFHPVIYGISFACAFVCLLSLLEIIKLVTKRQNGNSSLGKVLHNHTSTH
jgi:TRAP-type C4-dicarboxylate transport system permease small subunit